MMDNLHLTRLEVLIVEQRAPDDEAADWESVIVDAVLNGNSVLVDTAVVEDVRLIRTSAA